MTPGSMPSSPRARALLLAVGLASAGLGAWVAAGLWVKRGVEEPAFSVVSRDGDVEVRRYEPLVLAVTDVEGERDAALNEGFRRLAGYLFGGNGARAKLAMTAPVSATPESLARTAPVSATAMAGGRFRVSFVMPPGRTLEDLPEPNDPRVRLEVQPARAVAALRFAGSARSEAIAEHTARLLAWARANGREVGAPTLAQYDPPFTMPLLRRNEILVALR